jgi:hypothetical protein
MSDTEVTRPRRPRLTRAPCRARLTLGARFLRFSVTPEKPSPPLEPPAHTGIVSPLEGQKLGWPRSGPGPVAQPVFKTGEAAQPVAG